METQTLTEPTAETKRELTEAEKLLVRQRENLEKYRSNINQLLDWIEQNADRLDGLAWDNCHISPTVNFSINDWRGKEIEKNPRIIARRWPGVVWRRTANPSTCGVCDWVAKIDGIKLVIREAEKMRWLPMLDSAVATSEPEGQSTAELLEDARREAKGAP